MMGGLRGKRSSSLCVKRPKKNIKHHPLKHSSSLELLKLQQSANPPTQPMPMNLTPSNHMESTLTSKETRLLVKNYYVQVLKSAPAEGWNGQDGTIAVIIHELCLPLGSTGVIKNVLETCWSCMQN